MFLCCWPTQFYLSLSHIWRMANPKHCRQCSTQWCCSVEMTCFACSVLASPTIYTTVSLTPCVQTKTTQTLQLMWICDEIAILCMFKVQTESARSCFGG